MDQLVEDTLHRVPWLEATAMVLRDVQDHHTHADVSHSPRAVLKKRLVGASCLHSLLAFNGGGCRLFAAAVGCVVATRDHYFFVESGRLFPHAAECTLQLFEVLDQQPHSRHSGLE